ncbi:MAG: aspartate carbamoyltransferase [Oscillospiraceae bacterium]|nr:aspartate carbamoyltransferase [Oscillospiraceae bacterium]
MNYKHLIDLNDFSQSEWASIIQLALKIADNPGEYYGSCHGKIMATLFYEPSTRTQMSFQTAMLKLGGRIIGFDNPQNSSVAKGESLKDTIVVVSGYADIIAMRHPMEGSAKAASLYSNCPVINAGDGGHLHPTQTLTDLVTLSREKGRLSHLTVGLCGDLKNGRTVHSLIKALSQYEGNTFVLISTKELTIPPYVKEMLVQSHIPFTEVLSLEDAIPELDVLYMTRIQRERFSSEEEYQQQKDTYVLDPEKLSKAKSDLKILHPLPRVDEIDYRVDDDTRAIYFKQTLYGVYARMALIMSMLGSFDPAPPLKGTPLEQKCSNPRCITSSEAYLPPSYKEHEGALFCEYCEQRQG